MIKETRGARQEGKAQEGENAADQHIVPQLRDAQDGGDEFGLI